MQKQPILWPPRYCIKAHARARSVKLRARASGLEITVPPRFDMKTLPDLLEKHKVWIMKQLHALPVVDEILPTEINLQAQEQVFKIRYMATQHTSCKWIENSTPELVIMGQIKDENKCKKIIIDWLKKRASIFLNIQLGQLSQLIGLTYAHLAIRDQKTVWGSCTSQKHISLNYKLILLPYALMRYVIIHELCHTKVLNHSEKFWSLVAHYDADWENHRAVLRRGDQFMPSWLLT